MIDFPVPTFLSEKVPPPITVIVSPFTDEIVAPVMVAVAFPS